MILDTDILSHIVSPRCPERLTRELSEASGVLYTTAVNWAEICFGMARHPHGALLRARYEQLILPTIEFLDFDPESAEVYGKLRSKLEGDGKRLPEAGLMIASIALRHRLPLVSGNTRHFRRIPELTLLNWLDPE